MQSEKSPDGHSRDEMAIAVALSSPNLIRMLGVLEQPLGLVMELVQGRPLAEKPNFEVRRKGGRLLCKQRCFAKCGWPWQFMQAPGFSVRDSSDSGMALVGLCL